MTGPVSRIMVKEVRDSLKAGDLLSVRCWYGVFPYTHFGIYDGEQCVIELASEHAGDPEALPDLKTMAVRRTPLELFARKSVIHHHQVHTVFSGSEIVKRAESKLGEKAYCLVSGNCEHFARWCCIDQWTSHQVNEIQDRVVRLVSHTGMLLGARAGVRASTSSVAVSRNSLPSLAGELVEQLVHVGLSRTNMSPAQVQQSSRWVGLGAVAVIGTFLGGPRGSVSAVATHMATRAAIRLTRR
jgi:hypothetical protein